MPSRVQKKNFPLNLGDQVNVKVDYKNTSIPSYFQGPFVDQRNANGLMNWTADQELAVRQYIQQNIWAKTTEDILHKKKEILAMDKER
jgi:hypothetical protein